MPEIFKDKILKLLTHREYTPVKLSQLAKALSVSPDEYAQFKLAFSQLKKNGRVVVTSEQLVSLPPPAHRIIGTFRANPKGFGFVSPLEPNAQGDLFIPPKSVSDAMTGDIVEAIVSKTRRRSKRYSQPERKTQYTGQIVRILERAQNRFVGTLQKTSDGWLVMPDGPSYLDPISVTDISAKNAKQKDKIVVEIIAWPTEKLLAQGVITEVLGKAGQYETEISSIIHQFHLPCDFDESCFRQAREAAAEFDTEDLDGREDITDKLIITIDPADAKDFDDAISLEKNDNGGWILGVHIADVSYFIPSDSPLDKEAYTRGNSIYLPGKTIPMLPEILSNGICSLQPEQKRFCKSAYITYDKNANIINRRFANSVICSKKRLTYTQADKALKGRIKTVKKPVFDLLKRMEELALLIEQRRKNGGMLHLDLPETEPLMDKSGRIFDVIPADTSYPHTIIEMFMVEANDAVATLLDSLDFPLIRRIHPEPDSLTLKNLSKIIKTLGLSLPTVPDRFAIQNLLNAVRGKDTSLAVNLLVLRTFEKAQYAPLQIGHYALASTNYCHFTSPIRRYADLMVHRLLDAYIRKDTDKAQVYLDLNETGKHITFTEQRAEDAERELKAVLILQFLSEHIGEVLDCVVTGVAGFGAFAQSSKYGVEGLIRLQDLGNDTFKFNQKNQCLVGQRTAFTIRIGMPIKVRILSINVPARQLNLAPVEPLVNASGHSSTKKRRPRKSSLKEKYTDK
ncbi:MAG: ribonuclease R [Planctomycetota bacterium]|jgi:ribonuclease R